MSALMKKVLKLTGFFLVTLGFMGCQSSAYLSHYDPNEFTLLIASSNHGEVGPCG